MPNEENNLTTRIAELEAEVESLKQRLDARGQTLLAYGCVAKSSLPPSHFTIQGLDECVLLVDQDGVVRFANKEMATLLGVETKQQLLRQPLADIDIGQLGEGFLSALVDSAFHTKQTNVIERTYPELAHWRVASGLSEPITLRFVCSENEGRVQIVIQDVTKLRWLEKSFSRYISPKVIAQLMTMPQEALMKGERKNITILFTDLRRFTAVCEKLDAGDVCELLNEHFERIVAPVMDLDGTVDKFVGDGMMAVFGAPYAMSDYALRALVAATRMMESHNEWLDSRNLRGKPAAGLGIGISSGSVVVGNVGTELMMDYTAQGVAVNIASRLCGAAKSGEILTEKTTYDLARRQLSVHTIGAGLPHISFEPAGQLTLKNVSKPLDAIRVLTK